MDEDLKFMVVTLVGTVVSVLAIIFASNYIQDRELQRAILAKEHNVSIGVK